MPQRTEQWTTAVAVLLAAELPLPFEQRRTLTELMDHIDDIDDCRRNRNREDERKQAAAELARADCEARYPHITRENAAGAISYQDAPFEEED